MYIPATIGWCAFFPYVHWFDFIHDNSRLCSCDEAIVNGANRFRWCMTLYVLIDWTECDEGKKCWKLPMLNAYCCIEKTVIFKDLLICKIPASDFYWRVDTKIDKEKNKVFASNIFMYARYEDEWLMISTLKVHQLWTSYCYRVNDLNE